MVAFLRIYAIFALSRGTIRIVLAHDFAGDNYNLPLAGLLLHTATIEPGFTQESIFSSHETLRWREMDSNFQYAGAVNLFVAPFVVPGCLGRVGAP